MAYFRDNTLTFDVKEKLDYKKGIDDLPKSDVLKFIVDDGWFAVRPSGTEPEIKFCFGAVADSKSNAQKRIEFLRQSVLELCDKILNSWFNKGVYTCVVLYGSYARGDYDDESDIDVMALVDMDRSDLNKYRRCVSEMANDIDLKYNVLLSIKLQDKTNFDKHMNSIPLYQNIVKEGLKINV